MYQDGAGGGPFERAVHIPLSEFTHSPLEALSKYYRKDLLLCLELLTGKTTVSGV